MHVYPYRCGPCQVIAPKIEDLEKEYTSVKFYKVDVDKLSGLAKAQSVTAMPTFLVFKDGKVVKTIVGADLNRITNAIKELAQEAAPAASASS